MSDYKDKKKWKCKLPEVKLPYRIAIYSCVALLLSASVQISLAKEGQTVSVTVSENTPTVSDSDLEGQPDDESVSDGQTEKNPEKPEEPVQPEKPEMPQEDSSVSDSQVEADKEPEEVLPDEEEPSSPPQPDGYYEETVSENVCITSFMKPVKTEYEVQQGTALEEAGLPEKLTANTETTIMTTYRIYELSQNPEAAHLTDEYAIAEMSEEEKDKLPYHEEVTTEKHYGVKTLPVEWDSEAYEMEQEGLYDIEAKLSQEQLDGYRLEEGVLDRLPKMQIKVMGAQNIVTLNYRDIYCNGYPITLTAGEGNNTKFMYMGNPLPVEGLAGSAEKGYDLRYLVVYGGKYNGAVKETNLTMEGGNVNNLMGAGRNGSVEGNVNLTISGGKIETINKGDSYCRIGGDINVNVSNIKLDYIKGAGKGDVIGKNINLTAENSTVYISITGSGESSTVSGDVHMRLDNMRDVKNVYGTDEFTTVNNVDMTINDSNITANIFGGPCHLQTGAAAAGSNVKGNVTMEIVGSMVAGNVYGGGEAYNKDARVHGNVQMTLKNTQVSGIVKGCGMGTQEHTVTNGSAKIYLDGATIQGLSGENVDKGTSVILKNNPMIGDKGIDLSTLIGNRVTVEGELSARDGRIVLLANAGQFNEVLAEFTSAANIIGVNQAFRARHKEAILPLMVDITARKLLVGEQRELAKVAVTLDGKPYEGLKGLTAVKKDDATKSYSLYEMSAGSYVGQLQDGTYKIMNDANDTGQTITVSGSTITPSTPELKYVTQTIRISGNDGVNGKICFLGKEYVKPESTVVVLQGDTVTVEAVEAENIRILKSFSDTENVQKDVDDAKGGYSYEVKKAGTISAVFVQPRAVVVAEPSTVDFGKASVGYTRIKDNIIRLRNIGDFNTIKILRPKSEHYEILGFENNPNYSNHYVTLGQNDAPLSLVIKPKKGLPAGSYIENIPVYIWDQTTEKDVLATYITPFFEVVQVLNFGISGQTHLLAGESTKLVPWLFGTGAGEVTYEWSNGETTPEISVAPATTTDYSLTITDQSGVSVTRSITVNVEQKRYEIAVNTATLKFGTVRLEDTLPAAQELIITNKGNMAVDLEPALTGTGAQYYTYSILGKSELKPGETAKVQIRPKDDTIHSERVYDTTAAIVAKEVGGAARAEQKIALTFTVYSDVMSYFTAEDGAVDCGAITEGFEESQAQSHNLRKVRLTYYGSKAIKVYSPNMAGQENFTFDGFDEQMNTKTFQPGETHEFSVYPREGITANGYREVITSLKNAEDNSTVMCDLVVEAVVNAPLKVKIESSITDFTIVDQEYIDLTAEITGGTAPYTYAWSVNPGSETYNTKLICPSPAEGTHVYTVQVTDASGITKTCSQEITVAARRQSLALSPATLDFGSVSEGYTKLPVPQKVTATNNGNTVILLEEPSYEVTQNFYVTEIDKPRLVFPGEAFTFTVQPKEGFVFGTYRKTIELLATGADISVGSLNTKFLVTNAPIIAPMKPQTVQRGDLVTIEAAVTEGLAPYQYQWDTGQKTAAFEDMPEEDQEYIVTVTDAAGSKATGAVKITVTEPLYDISLSTTGMDFGSVLSGYTISPQAQNVKVTNEGTKEILLMIPEQNSFRISGAEGEQELRPGEAVTYSIEPKLGLSTGSHEETLQFKTDQKAAAQLKLKFYVQPFDETLSIQPSALEFGNVAEGYKKVPAAKAVVIENKGNTAVTVKPPAPKSYRMIGFDSQKTLLAGEKFSFSIEPNQGLTAGVYKEALKLTAGKKNYDLSASITVSGKLGVTVTGALQTEAGIATVLTANITGGIKPYSYHWSNGQTTETISVSPMESTEYSVTVTDGSGATGVGKARVTVKERLHVKISGLNVVEAGESTTLTAEAVGGVAPYTYSWKTEPIQTTKEIKVSPKNKTTYEVTVTDHLGATVTERVIVSIAKQGVPISEPVHTIVLSESNIDFGVEQEGYTAKQLQKDIIVSNQGNANVTLKVPTGMHVAFADIDRDMVVKPGESISIGIMPKSFLEAGIYEETIVLRTAQDTRAECKVAFQVTEALQHSSKKTVLSNEKLFISKNYTYGQGMISLEIEDEENQNIIGIARTEQYVDTLLTQEEKRQVENGETAVIRLLVDTKEDSLSKKDREVALDTMNYFKINMPQIEMGMFVDVTLEKQIGSGAAVQMKEDLQNVELVLKLPDSLQEMGNQFYLVQIQEQIGAQIAQWNVEEKLCVFNSNTYGSYAVMYLPKPQEEAANAAIDSYKRTIVFLWLLLPAAAVGGIAAVLLYKRKNSKHN